MIYTNSTVNSCSRELNTAMAGVYNYLAIKKTNR